MSGLTSPAASAILPSVTVAPPSVNAAGVPSLAAFIDLMIGKIVLPGAKSPAGKDERQGDADTGKTLPGEDKQIDPTLAWLFAAMPLSTPQPIKVGPPVLMDPGLDPAAPDILIASNGPDTKSQPIDPTGTCEVEVAKPRMLTLPVSAPDTGTQSDKVPASAPDAGMQSDKVPMTAPDAGTRSDKVPTTAPDMRSGPIKLPLIPPRLPIQLTPAPPVVGVALPAIFALPMTDRKDPDETPISLPAPVSAMSQSDAVAIIAPTGDAQRQTLDLGRQDWPQKMIDHIEALRDNANANDTSIRLKPEALGRVDIALRTQEDGAISVRFTAEQPTTRTLLLDATPQLAAVAESRGIRLSGTSVDLGGQGDQRPQPQAERAQPITNRLANARGDDNRAVDGGRIA